MLAGQNEAADPNAISSREALLVSVGARVGGGKVAGVAVVITLGGLGAVFGMWAIEAVGMATSDALPRKLRPDDFGPNSGPNSGNTGAYNWPLPFEKGPAGDCRVARRLGSSPISQLSPGPAFDSRVVNAAKVVDAVLTGHRSIRQVAIVAYLQCGT